MKTRYDFKAIRAKARELGWGYRIKFYSSGSLFGLRYWIQAPISGDLTCSEPQKTNLQAHNNATMELRDVLINMGVIAETDYVIEHLNKD